MKFDPILTHFFAQSHLTRRCNLGHISQLRAEKQGKNFAEYQEEMGGCRQLSMGFYPRKTEEKEKRLEKERENKNDVLRAGEEREREDGRRGERATNEE